MADATQLQLYLSHVVKVKFSFLALASTFQQIVQVSMLLISAICATLDIVCSQDHA